MKTKAWRNLVGWSALFLCSQTTCAQSPFVSDRPGAANGAAVVGKGVLQWQSGFNYQQELIEQTSYEPEYKQHLFSESTFFRYGLNANSEVTLGTGNSLFMRTGYRPASSIELGTISAGVRSLLTPEEGKFDMAVHAQLLIPLEGWGSSWYDVGSDFALYSSFSITPRLLVTNNLGIRWVPEFDEEFSREIYGVLNVSHSFSDKLGGFVELYAGTDIYDMYFDAGVSYQITENFQLDFFGGFPTANKYEKIYFLETGFTWRIIPPKTSTE